jgi:hypothetical protein
MKTKISLVSVMMLVVCFMPLKNSGQDTLTVGQVYDFEVGDVFHYEENFYGALYKKIHTITDKYYSANNDTLFYFYDFESAVRFGWEDTTWTYYSGNDILIYIDLDSLVHYGTFTYFGSDPDLYNNRYYNKGVFCDFNFEKFVVGCGIVEEMYDDEYTGEFLWSRSLEYYKKGVEEWGNPIEFYTRINQENEISEIKVYPNPASDYLHIDFEKSSTTIEQAILYNHLGQKVLEVKQENNTVDVSGLTPGMYFIEVITNEGRIGTKLVIE